MLRKSLVIQLALLCSFVWLGAGVWAGASGAPSAIANPAIANPTSAACTDDEIVKEVVAQLKTKFKARMLKRFHFSVRSTGNVITLKGFVSGTPLRDSVILRVVEIAAKMSCKPTVGIVAADFRPFRSGHCPLGEVQCPNGDCKSTLSECEINPFGN
jgi:hypothetical protein